MTITLLFSHYLHHLLFCNYHKSFTFYRHLLSHTSTLHINLLFACLYFPQAFTFALPFLHLREFCNHHHQLIFNNHHYHSLYYNHHIIISCCHIIVFIIITPYDILVPSLSSFFLFGQNVFFNHYLNYQKIKNK